MTFMTQVIFDLYLWHCIFVEGTTVNTTIMTFMTLYFCGGKQEVHSQCIECPWKESIIYIWGIPMRSLHQARDSGWQCLPYVLPASLQILSSVQIIECGPFFWKACPREVSPTCPVCLGHQPAWPWSWASYGNHLMDIRISACLSHPHSCSSCAVTPGDGHMPPGGPVKGFWTSFILHKSLQGKNYKFQEPGL